MYLHTREQPIGQDGTQRRLSGLRLPQVAGGAKLHELLNYTPGNMGIHTLNLGEQLSVHVCVYVHVHVPVCGHLQGEEIYTTTRGRTNRCERSQVYMCTWATYPGVGFLKSCMQAVLVVDLLQDREKLFYYGHPSVPAHHSVVILVLKKR